MTMEIKTHSNLKIVWILTGLVVLLAGTLAGILIYLKSKPQPTRGIIPLIQIQSLELDSSKWGVNFPNQYSTFLKTETNSQRTTYGGSEPYSKLEADPRLVELFGGYGFSIDYNEERGHMNSLIDVRSTKRVE